MRFPLGKIKVFLTLLFMVLAVNFMTAQTVLRPEPNSGEKMVPNGDGTATSVPAVEEAGPTGQAVVTGNGINYNGGPVLKGNPVPIYIIWYGNWSNGPKPSDSATTVNLIDTLLAANALGNS